MAIDWYIFVKIIERCIEIITEDLKKQILEWIQ